MGCGRRRVFIHCLIFSICIASIRSFSLLDGNFNKNTKRSMSLAVNPDPPTSTPLPTLGTLRIHGPDANGIVAAFSQLLYGHGCGIVDSEQHTDHAEGIFFQRIHFDYSKMLTDRIALQSGVNEVCTRFQMVSTVNWGDNPKQVAIMVSKYDHCLWELLLRYRAGELNNCNICLIVSNHPDLQPVADAFQIPFHVFKITKDTKEAVEKEELDLFAKHNVDLVVLARYMQIVTDNFCETVPVINIHHSFLPAFIGGKPYHRAHARGVKLIGATAHYATADLDEGPIIEQDITRISHRDEVDDLLRKGRLLEKNVLVHAVKAHIEDRVIVYKNKCVVFNG